MKHLFLLLQNHGFIAMERAYRIKVLMKLMLENVSWVAKFLHNTEEIRQPPKTSEKRPVRETAEKEKAELKLSLDCHSKGFHSCTLVEMSLTSTSTSPTS